MKPITLEMRNDMFSVLDGCAEDIENFIEKIKPGNDLYLASLSHIRNLLNVCHGMPKDPDHAQAKAILNAWIRSKEKITNEKTS